MARPTWTATGRSSARQRRRQYGTARWQRLRLQVFERDGWRCTDCQRPGALECDHITRDPALFWEPSNLRTLCRGCHIERHAAERRNADYRRRARGWIDFARELS